MFLSRGDRDLGVAFQTHPGRDVSKTDTNPCFCAAHIPVGKRERESNKI